MLHTAVLLANPYLQAPQIVTTQEIEHVADRDKSLDFTWYFSGAAFNCIYHQGKAGFALTVLTLPAGHEAMFKSVTQDGVSLYAYTRGEMTGTLPVPELYRQPKADYHVAKPRCFKQLPQTQTITLSVLAQYITEHTVIFYTGAGLSIASGVPSMAQLEAALHIERVNRELNITTLLSHSAEILENIKKFCDAARDARPSVGHHAITSLAQKKRCAVFTENVDGLHQKSGILPLMVEPALKQDASFFKDIDAIICIGLSHDDRGLLALYKEYNPTGVIISLDLQQPNYLGQEDMLLLGDAQEILPVLAEIGSV